MAALPESARAAKAPASRPPGGSGALPKGPPPGSIDVDYGTWSEFRITGTRLVPSPLSATVEGRFRYLGGGRCRPATVEVTGLFYDEEGIPVGHGIWKSEWATGSGTPLPPRERLRLEVYGMVRHEAESARIKIARVSCA